MTAVIRTAAKVMTKQNAVLFSACSHCIYYRRVLWQRIWGSQRESITYVAAGCHNSVKVMSSVYACGNVYKAVVLLGISLPAW